MGSGRQEECRRVVTATVDLPSRLSRTPYSTFRAQSTSAT